MKLRQLKWAVVALLFVGAGAEAQDSIRLGEPQYGGNGCPAGSASSVLSPDAKQVSILFDQFSTQAGGNSGLIQDRKSCNVAIPAHVPNGYSVSVFKVDYRGYTFVPSGASARLNVEYFFANQQGPAYAKTFAGPLDSDFFLNNTLQTTQLVWSGCGEDVILRTNMSLSAQTNNRRDETRATVDSQDISSAITYHVSYRRCDPPPPPSCSYRSEPFARPNITRVSFRTMSGHYMVAEGGGCQHVGANRVAVGDWEQFALINLRGPGLYHGDPLNIASSLGRYFAAEGGGGSVVNANRLDPLGWEVFTIERADGPGEIRNGDRVYLRAPNGMYLAAEGGGGGDVNANRLQPLGWETFQIEFR